MAGESLQNFFVTRKTEASDQAVQWDQIGTSKDVGEQSLLVKKTLSGKILPFIFAFFIPRPGELWTSTMRLSSMKY